MQPCEASPDDVARFFVELAGNERPGGEKPLALNTLRIYRSGLNDHWHNSGTPSPASAKIIDRIFQGLARIRDHRPRRVKALREFQLLSMLERCNDSRNGLRDAALLSMGFAAALRRSELCALQVEDLERRGAYQMIVHLRRSKTDAPGAGQKVAVIEGKAIKPIRNMERWLEASGIENGYLFQTIRRDGTATGRHVDPTEVARIVKRYVRKIDLDPKDYSGHSLRAGFVTSAAAHHARIDKIMDITRHKSAETVLKYIRDEESFVDHAGASFL